MSTGLSVIINLSVNQLRIVPKAAETVKAVFDSLRRSLFIRCLPYSLEPYPKNESIEISTTGKWSD
jgi:hypothetical protein